MRAFKPAPIDMRAGRNGLAALAREVMQKDPFSNSCFLFTNKRYAALKILACQLTGRSEFHYANT
jgi:transposase